MIKPLFRWAGGKTRYIHHIAPLLTKTDTYVEPFFGGGAVFCHVANQGLAQHFVINDINAEIMGIYSAIKVTPLTFISDVLKLQDAYLPLDKAGRKAFYYSSRAAYWKTPEPALLFFLLKTSFNGIWQTCKDSHGLFGTPCGLLNEKEIVDYTTIAAWHPILKNATILSTDFTNVAVPNNSLVYADPPYRESFTNYGTGFNDADQIRTVDWCAKTSKETNSTVIMSNKSDGVFFESLLPDKEVVYFSAKHTAGRKNKPDGSYGSTKAKEMLVLWRPRD
jgi:DNA adenine methylase